MIPPLTKLDYQKTMLDYLELNKKMLKGINNLLTIEDVDVDLTDKELIHQEGKMKLYHYKPLVKKVSPVPTVVVYALVNRQYMMDLHQNRSVIRNWLEHGMDVYIVDWGYPDQVDKYLTMEDYIDGYVNDCVDVIRERTGHDKINMLGVCQGGTFGTIYAALYPEKIRNLVTMVAPIDFSIKEGLLFHWSKYMDIDKLVDAYGIIPGDFMNFGFLMLKPFQLMVDKYVGLMDNIDDPEAVKDFLRMEKWIFDSPGQAGEAFRTFIKELYQENKLIKNEFELGGRKVDLRNIEMPVLNVFAEQDHLVPPSASRPLNDAISSKDNDIVSFPGGHIGLYVSSGSQKHVAPAIANWLNERSKNGRKASSKKKK